MKLSRFVLILVSWCAVFSVLPQKAWSSGPFATVTFLVVDENGLAVAECRVEHFVDRDHEMVSHFNGLQGTEIPYGVYKYALKRRGSGLEDVVQGSVSVWVPESLVVVPVRRTFIPGVSVDRAMPPGFFVRGRVEPVPVVGPNAERIWIRLSPLHGREQLDVAVDPTGDFRIYQPLEGRYLLSVIRGDEVLDVQQISFQQALHLEDFVVRLPDHLPPVLRVPKR